MRTHYKDLHLDLKRKFVLERLLEAGVTKNKDGIDIYNLNYEDLKHELTLQAFRDIDAESDAQRWF